MDSKAKIFVSEDEPLERLEPDRDEPIVPELAQRQKRLGFIFGIVFGFLLQKGGVAKYDVLVGALLLQDFTVFKVILSAVAIGSLGVYLLHYFGLVQLQYKATRYAANVIGGLIFGVGFGLLGYCPGTGAAALGQGNFDALAGVAGLIAGSYLYAEMSGYLSRTVQKWGARGKLILPELLHLPPKVVVPALVAVIGVALAVIEILT